MKQFRESFKGVREECSMRPVDPELCTRTSWVDAKAAYKLVTTGRATGNKCGLLLRAKLQIVLYKLGCGIQRRCTSLLIVGIIVLSLSCIGLKNASIESDVSKLWVEEGGRLERELKYTETMLGKGYGSSGLIIVQTPEPNSRNVLTVQSLQQHLDAVLAATQVEVELFDKTWRFEDLCYKATFPSFEDGFMESVLDPILPCIVITPLDCFWEGSKILGPRNPLVLPTRFGQDPLSWSNLNPDLLIRTLEGTIDRRLDSVKDALRRAGITSGYQQKPCLNPLDPECPVESVNYKSEEPVQPAPVFTGGCPGFAPEYMHWEEDMIIGGTVRNRSNILVSAEALQTVVQLMGEQELFNYYQGNYVVNAVDWTEDKAKQIIEREFREAIVKFAASPNSTDMISAFTQASLDDLIKDFTSVPYVVLAIGYGLVLVYAILTFISMRDAVQSQAAVAISGVPLVTLSIAAGLGVCSALQLEFNAATTQIIPFLALGLGVNNMFLMVYTFSENYGKPHVDENRQIGELLRRTGTTVLLTTLSIIGAFLAAAIVPIPALRIFALQMSILLLFNLLTMILLFPCILSLNAMRQSNYRIDVLCCIEAPPTSKVGDISAMPASLLHSRIRPIITLPPLNETPVTTLSPPPEYSEFDMSAALANSESTEVLTPRQKLCGEEMKLSMISLQWLVARFYIPLLAKTWMKVVVCVLSLILLSVGIYGATQVRDGMELTELVPKDTNEHQFLTAQSRYFGFYNMFIITQDDFAYHLSENQKLLKNLHQAISGVENVIVKDDGSSHELWLDLMTQWLRDLQGAFDRSYAGGCFHRNGWYYNATDDAVFGYKLIIQTGDMEHPIDRSRVAHVRLVDNNGHIRSDGFYNYLTAWISNDLLPYDISQATIRPIGKEWIYVPRDSDLLIPKSPAISFARMPFFLHNLGSTEQVINCVKEIRQICDEFNEAGIPNYPSGILFTFWEQYLHIRYYLIISLAAVLGAVFLFISITLMNLWAAALLAIMLAINTTELFGFMGLLNIKLSAVPAVVLIVSIGIGVDFTFHILIGFLTSIGDRKLRIERSLTHMFTPVMHGAVSTLLGIIMLAGSEFDFVVRYFFLCFLSMIVLGLVNGLLVFPVILSVIGPPGDVQSENKQASSIEPPSPDSSPPPSPVIVRRPRRTRRPQLQIPSTISEESSQMSTHSQEVDTTPHPGQVKVKTTATVTPSAHHPTMTKATVTVETVVHTGIGNSTNRRCKCDNEEIESSL